MPFKIAVRMLRNSETCLTRNDIANFARYRKCNSHVLTAFPKFKAIKLTQWTISERFGIMRAENDTLGALHIEDQCAYGIQTARALSNFEISGTKLRDFPQMVKALATVKLAAAKANKSVGALSAQKADAIVAVAEEIIDGMHHEHFVVDMLQGGAGTSSNMNCNEVIANIALRRMGHSFGDYAQLHPNDDVNKSQSTNDVYPTAIRIALLNSSDHFLREYGLLRDAFESKAREFSDIVKVGRTQLKDAVPMTVGDEFAAFAATLSDNIERVRQTRDALREINLGGTAIGNGITAPSGYRERVVQKLNAASGNEFYSAENLFGATYDQGALVLFSSALKSVAIKLSKISSDLRLLSSGPRAGFGELNLPAMQAGSSIMPGKVNPVIPEVVNQVCYAVIGNDLTVTLAAEAGQLQLNAMEPVLLHRVLDSINLLENSMRTLRTRCIEGISVDRERCQALFENSLVLATELAAHIGYDQASAIAYRAKCEGIGLSEAIANTPNLPDDLLSMLTRQQRHCAT